MNPDKILLAISLAGSALYQLIKVLIGMFFFLNIGWGLKLRFCTFISNEEEVIFVLKK